MDALPPLSFLAPVIALTAALFARPRPGARPGAVPVLAEGAALAMLALALAGLVQVVAFGPATWGIGGGFWLLALRLDAISVTMTLLVAFVGWVVVRYARSYLDGERREGAFHAMLLGLLGAVLVLVQSGSLVVLIGAFLAVGAVLRSLLVFYPDRAEARRAASKFTLDWAGETRC